MGEPVKLPMKKGLGQTDRTDGWWQCHTAMAAYLGFMIIYATWRGFMEADFWIFSDFLDFFDFLVTHHETSVFTVFPEGTRNIIS